MELTKDELFTIVQALADRGFHMNVLVLNQKIAGENTDYATTERDKAYELRNKLDKKLQEYFVDSNKTITLG